MSIKSKLTLTIVVFFVLTTFLTGAVVYQRGISLLNEELKRFPDSQYKVFREVVQGDEKGLSGTIYGLTHAEGLARAIARRDKETLLAAGAPILAELRRDLGITHLYFIAPDGTVILRAHKHEEDRDRLQRVTFLKARSTLQITTGIEEGKNFFSVRAVGPVYVKGKLAGFIEVGEEFNSIFERMKRMGGNNFALVLDTNLLKKLPPQVSTEAAARGGILYPTDPGLSAALAPQLTGTASHPGVTIATTRRKTVAVGLSPLKDASGKRVGYLASYRDLTPYYASLWKAILANVAVIGAVLLAANLAVVSLMRKSVNLFYDLYGHIARVSATWVLEEEIPVTTDDEVGSLVAHFNTMLSQLDRQRKELNRQIGFQRIVMETIPVPTYYGDAQGNCIGCNSSFLSWAGLGSDDVVGHPLSAVVPFHPAAGSPPATGGREGADVSQGTFVSFDGTCHDVIHYRAPFPQVDGSLGGEIGCLLDITEQKRVIEKLDQSEKMFRTLFDSIADAVFVHDETGTIVEVNEAACSRLGYSRDELLRMKIRDIASPQDVPLLPLFFDRAARGGFARLIAGERRKDGTVLPVEVTSSGFEFCGRQLLIGITRDITDQVAAEETRTHLEQQLRQSQKMEAIGTLAGGVAHDFNNILTAITGYAELAKELGAGQESLCGMVNHILVASSKGAKLIRSLLTYSRKKSGGNKEPVDLNSLLGDAESLLTKLVPESVEFSLTRCEGGLWILANGGEMEQVVMNLVANARDAIGGKGTIAIATGRVEVEARQANLLGLEEPGGHALLVVEDTGSGMDEGTLERIFEPFFSTKEVGKGTGLGLAMVYNITKHHQGGIAVDSRPGRGTRFSLYFPLVTARKIIEAATEMPEPVTGSETVLLVEDDDTIRTMFRIMLQKKGYSVIEAADGMEGWHRFQEEPGRIDLLLTDVVMPRRSGAELYQEIRRVRPDLPTIMMSGYNNELPADFYDERCLYLKKPILHQVLLSRVRELLDHR
ncbi:PAS domain S-box protein [Geomonas sp. Red32]|uniref:PAS domain S-box protein n=1 Tax=Geomonas sp. Red32 TaxID=2912856 RepID=UPI00202CD637|nr:PAS domain S-box protein [Geomonas sp. Red32]MCM0082467.1 PAS domain S-box protein [Geomonas sp. Red32]